MIKFIISAFLLVSSHFALAVDTDKQLNEMLEKVRSENGIPALSAALIKPDTTFFGVSGTSKINGTLDVSLSDKFHIGSNAKAVASFIAMKMVENGLLSLESTIIEIFPEWKGNIKSEFESVTLDDLLSHNAGIQPYTSGEEYLKLPELKGTILEKRKAFAKFVLNEPIVENGTYSNAGYIIAAAMLENISQKSYSELLENTMKELGLDYFIGFPNKQDISYPWGHWLAEDQLTALPPEHFYKLEDFAAPAGDISMNIIDYSKFIRKHLLGLNNTGNYLRSSTYKKLHFGKENYAYGWGNAEINGVKVSFHDGSAGTFYCHVMIIPKSKVAVIIMSNSAEQEHINAIYQLRESILIEFFNR